MHPHIRRIVLSLLLLASVLGAGARNKNIMVLNSYNESAAWSQSILTTVVRHVTSLDEFISIEIIHLNTSLIHNDADFDQMVQGVFQRYPGEERPDYVVMLGEMAFMLRDRIYAQWGRLPMVLIAPNDKYGPQEYYYTYPKGEYVFSEDKMLPLSQLQGKYNFTLVQLPNCWKETVDMMMYMFPDMKQFVFLADGIALNHMLDHHISAYIRDKYPQVEYSWLIGDAENGDKLRLYLDNRDYNVGLLLSTWFYEKINVHGYPTLISGDARMIATARRPVFALRNAYFIHGITGGVFPSPEEMQAQIETAIGRLLSGADMTKVPFQTPGVNVPIVSWRQLEEDGLSPSICPPGTQFLMRPESFWEENRGYVIAGIAGLLLVIAGAITYITLQRKRIDLLTAHKSLIASMPIAYTEASLVYDEGGKVVDLTYHHGNAAFLSIRRNNPLPADPERLFYPEFISSIVESMLAKKKPVSFTYYFKQTDRYYEFILSNTFNETAERVTDLTLFAIDITDKSKAESDLREFARKLDLTLNVARIVPWRWDLVSGKISCELQRVLTHTSLTDLPGNAQKISIISENDYFSRIHPEDLPKVREKYQLLVGGKIQYTKLEYRVQWDKRGTLHTEWVEINAAVNSRDRNGRPTGMIGSMLIITQRKLQEEQLISARARAQESDRLKSAFLANMSHELRTPLNAIVGFSSLLTKTQDQAKRQKFISIIEDNNQLLLQLISDVLDLAKVESGTLDFKLAPADINELMESVRSSVQLRVQPGVALNMLLGAPECRIITDAGRVAQVLINLLTNASKFTEKGAINFGYEIRDTEVYFFVRDTGIGISPENISKLFDRFVKLNTFVQGTGLGLSISKNIVEKLGGEIGATSRGEGKGSTFWFTLPYHVAGQPRPEVPAPPAPPQKELRRDEITILIAEDNEANYLLFQSILEHEYRLIHAWDGAQAVKLFDAYRPALVIMDINLPVMDGYEATKEIRKLSADVPVIAVTAYSYASDQDKILESGFNSYVAKPVNADRLHEELRHMISTRFVLV